MALGKMKQKKGGKKERQKEKTQGEKGT